MRVAMVVDRFPNEPFLAQQVAGLLDRGVDVHVLCQIVDQDSDAWAHLADVDLAGRLHPWPDRGRYPALAAAAVRTLGTVIGRGRLDPMARALSAERARPDGERGILGRFLFDLRLLAVDPDIVHFQFGDLARARIHAADAIDVAFTSSFRGYDLAYAGLDQPGFYDRLWPVLDGAHTLGRDLLAAASGRGAPDGVPWRLISPAIDIERFDPPDRSGRRPGPSDPIRLLSVGRLHWKKGLTDALEAVAGLVADGRSVTYRIIGDGPAEEQLRWLIDDLGLGPVVELVGRCAPDEVAHQLSWADLFLHPSHTEGFANAVLEAQAMAVPIVCSDAEGLAENVADGHTGLVVPRRRPDALAVALAELIDSPDRRLAMGLAGRQRVADRFTIDRQIEAYVAFFAAAIDRREDRGQDRRGRRP